MAILHKLSRTGGVSDITLQINLSPGDIAYAHLTIPKLVEAHRAIVSEVLAVVDCCRPQRTKIVDTELRFPEPAFSERVKRICAITVELKAKGYVDRIFYLRPDSELIPTLAQKYLNNLVCETHDYGGCALMSYFAALEVPRTRYIVHYDADMLLHQEAGYDWASDAINLIGDFPRAVAASPRISPPFSLKGKQIDAPSLHEGRAFSEVRGGWRNDWFSTRCFLIDKDKLQDYLPVLRGRAALETLAVKYLRRGYPRSPEIMLFRRIGSAGGWRLNLRTEKAWLLHPHTKPPEYLSILPQIQESVEQGRVPEAQRGYADINLLAWQRFLSQAQV